MAFNTIDPNLEKPMITPAQEAALMRHVGYNGPLEEASVRLSPEQKTKLTIMAKAFKSMRSGKMPIKTGDAIGAAKGGYLFSADELGDPQVKNRMEDNPEFSEFAVDQQNATANKMQQRFAQPEDRMRQQTTRGYVHGGIAHMPTVPDLVEQERLRLEQEKLRKLAADQAATMANVYGDPSKVITPSTVGTTPITADQTIAAGAGDVSSTDPIVDVPDATAVTTATAPTIQTPAGVMEAATVSPAVKTATDDMTAVSGTVGDDATVTAATDTTTSVSDLNAAQGTATLMTNPVQRKIETGEIVTGAADAATAAAFTEQVQAATATPTAKATVKGQLDSLMDDFEGGATPAWAAGAMRAATAAMAARGLGASSMAGQAIIQATMESALPIAQADAQVTAQFEAQNLSNRQQRAMLAAEQRATFMGMEFTQEFQARVQNSARIGDIANMNFTADQQVALENSRAVNTMNLSNLTNSQAMVMAEASALSNLDMSNLNNRQQAAVQNAQNFMQMDMQNLGNAQQTAMFKQQQIIQSLFTDQAAENAANQINAASENQTQQFFSSLASQTQQFNATQSNAMSQFDAGQVNTIKRFNKEVENQRDQFNATNRLVIAQANTQWRQNIATIDTAAQNEANMQYAKSINDLTSTAIDQLWQRERDLMGFAFKSSESASERALKVALQEMSADAKERLEDDIGKGAFLGTILDGVVGSIFGTRKRN